MKVKFYERLHDLATPGQISPNEKQELRRIRADEAVSEEEFFSIIAECGWTEEQFHLGTQGAVAPLPAATAGSGVDDNVIQTPHGTGFDTTGDGEANAFDTTGGNCFYLGLVVWDAAHFEQ